MGYNFFTKYFFIKVLQTNSTIIKEVKTEAAVVLKGTVNKLSKNIK